MSATITIPRKITNGNELIVIKRKEYEKLQKRLLEISDALSKIRRGEKELKEGKTKITVKSLSEIT